MLRTIDAVSAIEREWDSLYFDAEPRNAFLSHPWTLACWAAQTQAAQPFVVTLRRGGRLVAIAPLCIETQRGFRVLRFIADDRSDYLGFLCKAGMPDLERSLLETLMRFRGEWDLILLRQLTDSYSRLHEDARPAELEWHKAKWTNAPYLTAVGDWDEFHKTGPSWLREMRKRGRRFLRDGHTVESLTGSDAVGRLDDVSRIESRSWKGRLQTTRLQPGRGRELLAQAFETLGTRGEMSLRLAYVDGQAVAFQIDFELPGRIWHYQCAYDEDFRQTRAGSVLTYLSLEKAWQRGVREFDYLSGEEPYKAERTNASRVIFHIAGHSRSLKGWTAYLVLLAPRWRLRNVPAFRKAYDWIKALKLKLKLSF